MADIAAVFRGLQLGPETIPGTSVAANKKLNAFGLSIQPQAEIEMFAPIGTKLDTLSLYGPEWVQAPFQGKLDFSQLPYLLAACIKNVAATPDGTSGKKYVYDISTSSADTIKTYTAEVGSDVHAQKFTYGHIPELTIEMSRRMQSISGNMVGQQVQDDIALTAAPTSVASNIIQPKLFDVKIATTQAGLTAASPFARPFKVVFKIGNRFGQIFRMSSTDTSFVAHVETKPTITLEFTVGADDADMTFLTNLRAGSTKFLRVQAIGDVISGAIPSAYAFQLDFSGQLTSHYAPGEDQGALITNWTFGAVLDPTWGKAFEIAVTNQIADLFA